MISICIFIYSNKYIIVIILYNIDTFPANFLLFEIFCRKQQKKIGQVILSQCIIIILYYPINYSNCKFVYIIIFLIYSILGSKREYTISHNIFHEIVIKPTEYTRNIYFCMKYLCKCIRPTSTGNLFTLNS